jgi:Protein of unknown function (DUF2971)
MAAAVQPPIVPRRLYRYRNLTRSSDALAQEIDSIKKRYLYCADFTVMNDPMEGVFRSSSVLRAAPDYQEILHRISNRQTGVGIACFSETHDSMLMWAHYAGNFQGICLGYSSRALLRGLPDDALLLRLAYLEEPPRLDPAQIENLDLAARRVFSQKQYNWAYEREWRVLARMGPISFGSHQAVRTIYLGTRISEAQCDLLVSAIAGLNVRLYRMTLKGYTPDWDEITV